MPEKREPAPAKERPLVRDATKGRVLIVEDDRGLLEAYADVLLEAGFDVAAASNGPGACAPSTGTRSTSCSPTSSCRAAPAWTSCARCASATSTSPWSS